MHARLTEALGEALDSREPLAAVRKLHAEWDSMHADRRTRIRELKDAIRREEAHYRYEKADQLRAEVLVGGCVVGEELRDAREAICCSGGFAGGSVQLG